MFENICKIFKVTFLGKIINKKADERKCIGLADIWCIDEISKPNFYNFLYLFSFYLSCFLHTNQKTPNHSFA